MTTWLIDKSVLVRLAASPDAAAWAGRIERGLVRITTVTRLEIGYSALSGPDLQAGLRQPPVSAMPVEYLTPAIEDRAAEVLTLLADRGQHRAPSIPDLLIAATAELAGLTVLHCDKDFDLIAAVTGQPAERLNARALIVGLTIFGVGSAVAMTASSVTELIGLRAVLGLGGGAGHASHPVHHHRDLPRRAAHPGRERMGRRGWRVRGTGGLGFRAPLGGVVVAVGVRAECRPGRRRHRGRRAVRARVG